MQHLVSSSIVMSVRGVWFLVTAGHVLLDLQEHENDGDIRVLGARLADCFGIGAIDSHPIPFDTFGTAPRFAVDEGGVDCAMIAPERRYVDLLERNNVRPVHEATWKRIAEPNLDKDGMILGFPGNYIERFAGPNGTTSSLNVGSILFPIEWVNTGEIPESHRLEFPRFTYRYSVEDMNEKVNGVANFKGMSGGPVIAFDKTGPAVEAWVVGILSSFAEKPMLGFATPLPIVGRLIERAFAGALWPDEGETKAN